MRTRARSDRPGSREIVLGTVHRNASSLLRLARQHSICVDDAHDAYQRGIEIFLRRADDVEPETALGWLRTVIKHEAMGIRRSRLQLVDGDAVDLDQHEASLPSPDEQVAAFDRLAASAEAMQRLKPQELRALWLLAQGLSYEEIGQATGWSDTKVNRCITEGRRSFIQRVRGIESGEECERWTPVLSAIADGEATSEQLVEVRPHLRNCPACRATIRDFHRAPRDISAVIPIPFAAAGLASAEGSASLVDVLVVILEGARSAVTATRDGIVNVLARTPGGGEAAGAALAGGGSGLAVGGAKVAALCVSVSVAAGGTYCLDSTGALRSGDPDRPMVGGASRELSPAENLRSNERATDRKQRENNAIQLAQRREPVDGQRQGDKRQRGWGQRAKRALQRKPPSPPAPAPSSEADGGFDFESGQAAASESAGPSSSAPAAQGSPPQDSSERDEFGGGGFEK
ncbi:MAG: zf-HC2 domain-containing protein [Solirubrobacteraceae bacterium]